MKKTIFSVTVSLATALEAAAQTSAALPTSAPGLPASPVNQGLPGFDNSFGPFFTNQFPNGFTSGSLNQLLLNLQFNLSQILPTLATVNDSFDFIGTNALGTSAIFGGTGVMLANPNSPTTLGNASTVLGTSTSPGTALSGGRDTAIVPSSPVLGGAATAIGPVAGSNGFVGGTNSGTGLAFTSTRDVLRALLILQDDVEKMLPLVNALNGGNAITLNTVFTNNLGTVTNTSLGTRQQITTTRTNGLNPTGR